MAKVAVGSFPEKIAYVHKREADVSVGCAWDISWSSSEDEIPTEKIKVLQSFPADYADEKMLARAKQWAIGFYSNKKEESFVDIVDNAPIKNVRVLSLEYRGQGGRAYKALIGNYYIDLREDVLMDILLKVGVAPGGILQGEFIWAKMGSQMKLVRIGSELHRLIEEFSSKKDIKPIGKTSLEIGGVYQDKKKNKAIFVGYVNTIEYMKNDSISTTDVFNFRTKPTKKAMLFYELFDYQSLKKSVQTMENKDAFHSYKIKSSHTYIEKVNQVEIPTNCIEYLRNKALKEVKQHILEYTGHKTSIYKRTAENLSSTIIYKSKDLNLYSYDEKVTPFEVKMYLTLS